MKFGLHVFHALLRRMSAKNFTANFQSDHHSDRVLREHLAFARASLRVGDYFGQTYYRGEEVGWGHFADSVVRRRAASERLPDEAAGCAARIFGEKVGFSPGLRIWPRCPRTSRRAGPRSQAGPRTRSDTTRSAVRRGAAVARCICGEKVEFLSGLGIWPVVLRTRPRTGLRGLADSRARSARAPARFGGARGASGGARRSTWRGLAQRRTPSARTGGLAAALAAPRAALGRTLARQGPENAHLFNC